ncbi:type II secretion system protein G [Anaerohalosphaera lusitana]|uniref:Type II secretion system protein G n=1 Tax=Anaerohalosphaera lusitana TaxID=1936003 RepID=A0A1U9NLB3_9BACT|nr:prepilin-type N-terminal cleavage/methylation domain-containing protein [Anaerohalosphaera lusitana]AQT68524.1 type II secretion system protein G [Anaerohalosphaera lusitana]
MTAERHLRYKVRSGFSLMELLVVIGIIMLLIGVLVPGMHAFSKRAKALKQKAQIHSMEVGLELFKKRHGSLPESKAVQDPATSKWVYGAQHLAEALVGRDERGFDPKSKWHVGDEASIASLYRNDETTDIGRRSLNRRYPPSFPLDDSVAIEVDELYDTYGTGSGTDVVHCSDEEWNSGPVLTDTFDLRRITYGGEKVKVGTPVLYYKANRGSSRHAKDVSGITDPTIFNDWIYNYNDNSGLMPLGHLEATQDLLSNDDYTHKLTAVKFYEMITNPRSREDYYRPYNKDGYILWSAGYDGLFGTKDDVTNFDR